MTKTIFLSLLAQLAFPLNASTSILAKKSGPFDGHDKCLITKEGYQMSLGEEHASNQFISRREKKVDSLLFKKLGKEAIKHKQSPYYQWALFQANYLVTNGSNLVVFKSEGNININNSSKEARELISQMDLICKKGEQDFRLEGLSKISLKIGERIFEDFLNIEIKTDTSLYPVIVGKYIVPDSFKADIKKLRYLNGKFSFEIRVIEGEDDYFALFEGHIQEDLTINGKAFILPGKEILGTFEGQRLKP